ncbi:MAG: type III-B CRISPR module-associated Cmr3 family protein [Myxococcales bacterium]|nr:CRISPR-associated protein Cmr3 [Myxococcota bacterium]MDW8284365.1 type III-B CRISPR module-associated Cmr3 family protein [Myxococcales bacterium]
MSWIIEPRDTLVVRDGRPIRERGAMRSVDFPWPSTVAGLVRTRLLSDPATGRFTGTPHEARRIPVAGPLLARLGPNGQGEELLVPAPRDCLWQAPEGEREVLVRHRLVPAATPEPGVQTDLPSGLQLVRPLQDPGTGKASQGPAFWTWSELEHWLCEPEPQRRYPAPGGRLSFGHPGLVRERRVHVAIAAESQTAAEGQLYSVEGLRFADRQERYGLWFRCDDPRLQPGTVPCGGERRLSWLRRAALPAPPPPQGLRPERTMRVVLLTPALFAQGALPQGCQIAGARVVAVCVPRPEPISGWDLERRGPKRTRWMVPAGSVYFVDVEGFMSGESWQQWLHAVWMQCISDAEQDRLDGFGLCVVGVG